MQTAREGVDDDGRWEERGYEMAIDGGKWDSSEMDTDIDIDSDSSQLATTTQKLPLAIAN
jgi:hypothetical protein